MADIKDKKFSLIDLLMIIMIVGIIFTFTVPLKQIKMSQARVHDILADMRFIANENVKFSESEMGDGDYAFDISQLNLQKDLNDKYFEFSLTDSSVVAVTKKDFGKAGAEIHYYLPNGPFTVNEDDLSRKLIDPNWLP